MSSHWAEHYVGRNYSSHYDCGVMVQDVLRHQFNKNIAIPNQRFGGLRGASQQIMDLKNDFAVQVQNPEEGDGVLMKAGRLYHMGVYCEINGTGYVLHNVLHSGVVLSVIDRLPMINTKVEGFYRWK